MILKHLTPAQYNVTSWSGGKTTQLAIYPENAVYADHDFLWRVSSASVELERSTFTSLPDYQRCISVLHGEMRLRHGDGPTIEIEPYQVHAFDGGAATESEGLCTDFNLMARKGLCSGAMESVRLAAGERRVFSSSDKDVSLLFYCAEGSAEILTGAESVLLRQEESLLIEGNSGEKIILSADAPSVLMVAQMKQMSQ